MMNTKWNLMALSVLIATLGLFQSSVQADNGHAPLEAQLGVTRDQIQQLIAAIEGKRSNTSFENADYKERAKEFIAVIELTLTGFENELKQTVLSHLAIDVGDYEAIYRSTVYSPAQNQALRDALFSRIQSKAKVAESAYQQAILKLYGVLGELPDCVMVEYLGYHEVHSNDSWCTRFETQYNVRWSIPSRNEHQIVGIGSVSTSTCGGGAKVDKLKLFRPVDYLVQSWVKPYLMKGCYSKSCLVLSLEDLKSYFRLVTEVLDKDLEITLADGRKVKITGYSNSIKSVGMDLEGFEVRDPSLTVKAVMNPAAGQTPSGLPFDVGPSKLPGLAEQRKLQSEAEWVAITKSRSGLLAELRSMMIDRNPISLKETTKRKWLKRQKELEEKFSRINALLEKICWLRPSSFDTPYRSHCVSQEEEKDLVLAMIESKVPDAAQLFRKKLLEGNGF